LVAREEHQAAFLAIGPAAHHHELRHEADDLKLFH
jgi:hypothetical protein